MATKTQITKYLKQRGDQARELSKIFEGMGKAEMAAQYHGEFELAQRLTMMIEGDLEIKEFI
jgi:hypothetical protein